ncbi:hypothetical protein EUA06_16155 [Nocardioides glacieisoli]|uniref:Ig-like domain-containing protein n=1 Tax=Nocardioides glacieisoli TaxID=1168730 RepID=A0A4Q2RL56_9ACTN|nr:hypothetical protein [Nocardioides glacieisoli]RYB89501.1 hypothetical protein EUA06_16155 [Nocardioides glacieisoli]
MGTLFGSPTSGASAHPGRRLGRYAALALVLPVVATPTAATAADESAPVVTNSVAATYDLDHAWQVFNAVDRNRADAPAGGTATVRYAVGVTALGPPARSGFEVAGTVGVTNPGEPVGATLSAELAGAGACTIAATDTSPAAGLQVVLPSGASSFAYSCAPGSAPTGPAATTATVAWDATGQPELARPAGTASAQAQADYAVDQKTDELTTVTTSSDGAAPVVLGTLDWDDVWAAPDHRVLVRTSSLALGVGSGPCADHTNVAGESADATTDSETVRVCEEPEVLGEQSFGKAVGRVRTTCQGTVRAHLDNRSGRAVFYYLRVGTKMHRFVVKSLGRKTVAARGAARAVVVLKAGSRQIERTQLPQRCQAPGVLPDTGLRSSS